MVSWDFLCDPLSFPLSFAGVSPAAGSKGSPYCLQLPFLFVTGLIPEKSLAHLVPSWLLFSEDLDLYTWLGL